MSEQHSIHLFDSLGRRFELTIYGVSKPDGSLKAHAKPRTYRDLSIAVDAFSEARLKLLNPENDIQKAIASCDAQNAINENGFARDSLDYIELLRLGFVHFISPPIGLGNSLNRLSQMSQLGGSSFNNLAQPNGLKAKGGGQ